VRGGLGLPLVAALERVVHEHHVGVAAVAELPPAQPSHPDHGDPRGQPLDRPVLRDRAARDRERPFDRSDGGRRERGADLVEVDDRREVGQSRSQQLASANRAGRAHGGIGVGVARDGGADLGRQGLRGARRQVLVRPQPAGGLGLPREQLRGVVGS
jgi:hypothetical protein